MYNSNHLEWRILIAHALKKFYHERDEARRNLKRIFANYGKYLLGGTYDTFLSYLKKEIPDRKLPAFIEAALALLEALRAACDRLRTRKPNTSWSLITIVEEVLTVLREEEKKNSSQKIHID